MERQLFHFEPLKGWMNDPNGLCRFRGSYHIFHQYNPYSLEWDRMHWGHAVTDDFRSFTYLPIALAPDEPYEDSGGCFSGSAVEKDGKLYLFYTSVSRRLGQTQSLAVSEDGVRFEKYADNPIIVKSPIGNNDDFRDPKVTLIGDKYCMVVASGENGAGIIHLFLSSDLLRWEYAGELIRSAEFGPILECPDLFQLGGKTFLSFSMIRDLPYRVVTLAGDFDGERFRAERRFDTESGPDCYAPQSFCDGECRISMGWIVPWRKDRPVSAVRTGALTVPREVTFRDGVLRHYPLPSFRQMMTAEDPHVIRRGDTLAFFDGRRIIAERAYPAIGSVGILRDRNIVEVFVNEGEYTATFWVFDDPPI